MWLRRVTRMFAVCSRSILQLSLAIKASARLPKSCLLQHWSPSWPSKLCKCDSYPLFAYNLVPVDTVRRTRVPWGCIRSCCATVPQSISDPITSYVGNFRLFRSAGHGASGKPDALQSLPRRALPSRNDLFHSKHRVRAMAALTVLNTRSHFPSRRPKHYLRGQHTASTAHQREVLPPGLTPSKKGR